VTQKVDTQLTNVRENVQLASSVCIWTK